MCFVIIDVIQYGCGHTLPTPGAFDNYEIALTCEDERCVSSERHPPGCTHLDNSNPERACRQILIRSTERVRFKVHGGCSPCRYWRYLNDQANGN
jgi:hypothetical protein